MEPSTRLARSRVSYSRSRRAKADGQRLPGPFSAASLPRTRPRSRQRKKKKSGAIITSEHAKSQGTIRENRARTNFVHDLPPVARVSYCTEEEMHNVTRVDLASKPREHATRHLPHKLKSKEQLLALLA